MDIIKKLVDFFAGCLNDFDFVLAFNKVVDFIKIFVPEKEAK